MKRFALAALIALAPAAALAQTAPSYQGQDGTTKEAQGTFPAAGSPSIATNQVSVGTTATLIAAFRKTRQAIILNVLAANGCAFGGPSVTTSTGLALQAVAGASVTLPTAAAIYGACSATTTIAFAEVY